MKDIEEYLNQIPMWAAEKNSLEDIRDYLKELGDPDCHMNLIHVAGTNGKGSVCAFMTAALAEAGYQAGTFISPHLEVTRERFLVNGKMVEADSYEEAFETVYQLAGIMTGRGYKPPTYFEFLFYMSMVIFAKGKPDFVILETGLGGRLDATNSVRNPILSIITSISMDHMQYLGNTVAKIATEKAGIIRPGTPVVYDDNQPEASKVIFARGKTGDCSMFPVSQKDYILMKRQRDRLTISVESTDDDQMVLEIPSVAEYQLMNVTIAVKALNVLQRGGYCKLDSTDVQRGIGSCRWPGRMEEVLPGVYLDGAHNVGGIQALTKTILQMEKNAEGNIHLLFAAVSDKEYGNMVECLCQIPIASVSIACMKTKRGEKTGTLAREFKKYVDCPVEEFTHTGQALEHVLSMKQENDLTFCIGSLYLVGEIKQILRRDYD